MAWFWRIDIMITKSHIKIAVLVALMTLCMNCGLNRGLNPKNVMDGKAVSNELLFATYEAGILCSMRLNVVPALPPTELEIRLLHDIDETRAYRKKDVDNCKDTIMLGFGFDPYCNYIGWKCNFNPVNSITGSN